MRILSRSGFLVVAAMFVAGAAQADPDPEVTRLLAAKKALKWNWTPPGQTERYGHGEVLVSAPLPTVRTNVLDFAHYKDFVPGKFRTSRVVGKEGPFTDLYLQVPIMHGAILLWHVVRFGPPRAVGPGQEVVEGKLVKGNVKAMNIQLTMRAVDDKTTLLKCDLLLLPEMAAPQDAIDEELRDAAEQAVVAIRDRSMGVRRGVAVSSEPTVAR